MRSAFDRLGATVLPIDEPSGPRVRRRLLHHVEEGGLDLVYERYSVNAYAASEVAREAGIPHFLEVNAPLSEEVRRFRPSTALPMNQERERLLFQNARVLAVSPATAEYARARGAAAERVTVVPNAVDPELFHPRPDDRLRERHVPPGRFVLGVHGRFRPWHNVPLLVRATRRLVAMDVPVFLLLVGHGDGVELVDDLPPQTATRVSWCPHEEVAALVACFDALPLTYAPQPDFYFSPLKLVEAMACGVVPIVPELGDLPQRVAHGKTGLVYPAGDEDALVACLAELARDPARAADLKASAAVAARRSTWLDVARLVVDQVLEGAR